MSTPYLPSPYEVARIAAALRGYEAGEKPEEAAKQALEAESSKESPEGNVANDPGVQQFAIGNKDHSEAMDWINANGGARDSFKSFTAFRRAFWTFEPRIKRTPHSVDEHTLRRFLEWRKGTRRNADTEAKRKKRQQKEPAKTLSNKSQEILAGHPLKVRRKKR